VFKGFTNFFLFLFQTFRKPIFLFFSFTCALGCCDELDAPACYSAGSFSLSSACLLLEKCKKKLFFASIFFWD
jgi:hypothetical protein